jgi:hypothetical protein
LYLIVQKSIINSIYVAKGRKKKGKKPKHKASKQIKTKTKHRTQ